MYVGVSLPALLNPKAIQPGWQKENKIVFEAIAELMTPPEKPKRKIGFEVKEKRASYGRKRKASRA